MSLDDHLTSETPYLDAVSSSLPSILSDLLMSFDIYSRDKLDTLVRFCAGGGCPARIAGHAGAWESGQMRLQSKLAQFDPAAGTKRPRDEDGDESGMLANGNGLASKKPKFAGEDGVLDTNSLYTLHSISITAPIRKKVDVSVTAEAIRLTNPTSGNLEGRIPLTTLKRAFIVSNLGKNKNKEQWAVTLISADSFDKKADAASQVQLTFNVDKGVPGGKDGFKTTAGPKTTQESHSKGHDTLSLLQTLLSYLPPQIEVITADKSSQAFKSSSDQPYVDAYLGAKEGALCFLPQGILWANARPCEFYPLEDLAPDSDTPGLGGVKTLSATGRTFSVFVRRRRVPDEDEVQDEEVDEQAEQGEETEFAMIDGRELENVNAWIRRYKSHFGKRRAISTATKVDIKGKGKARAEVQLEVPIEVDDSDESDEDYAAPSNSDGGEPTSDSQSDDDGEGTGSDEEDDAEVTDEDGGEQSEEELDPARHPLLRPGAMPRMSKAAVEAAVAMVNRDVLGSRSHEDENESDGTDDEEVDELE